MLARAEDTARGENGRSDEQLMQGSWKVVKRVKNGQTEDAAEHPTTLKFSGKNITEIRDGKPGKEGAFTLDATKTPKRITLKGTKGDDAEKVFEAIYEIDGNTMKLAYSVGEHANTPPKDFSGAECGLLVLERERS